MPSKKRSEPTAMQKLTLAEQDELAQRYAHRRDVRDANRELATVIVTWLVGRTITVEEFMERFNAQGHAGEYHENPSDTTDKRVQQQVAELKNIRQRLTDTPLDYMGAVELSYVYMRIQMIIELVRETPGGTMDEALDLYFQVGEAIRHKVYDDLGHYPEEFPTPRGRITGKEPQSKFKPTEHQPTLF